MGRFKLVNDRHGHLVGSDTLRQLARVLGECVRTVDTLARYGGDEFAALLTDTPPEDARTAAERIRATIAGVPYEDEEGRRVEVSVSIGVACYPGDSRDRDALVDLADKAMYRAKSLGRDRVVLAGELDRAAASRARRRIGAIWRRTCGSAAAVSTAPASGSPHSTCWPG